MRWYLPNDGTCSKTSSNSKVRFLSSDFEVSAMAPTRKTRGKKKENRKKERNKKAQLRSK